MVLRNSLLFHVGKRFVIENIEKTFIVFLPWLIFSVIMDNDGVLPDPVQGDIGHLSGHFMGDEIGLSKIVEGRIRNFGFLSVKSGKDILIGKQQFAAVFADIRSYGISAVLFSQDFQIHKKNTGIDIRSVFFQIQPVRIKFSEEFLDMGGGDKGTAFKVHGIQIRKRIDNNQIRIQIKNAVQAVREQFRGKQSEIHFFWISFGCRALG